MKNISPLNNIHQMGQFGKYLGLLFPKFLIGFLYSHGRQTSRAYDQNEVVIDFVLVPL